VLAVYLRPRVLLAALLGFSGGLPLALSGSTLAIWMADLGIDLAAIGLISLVGLPYTFKFLWAPVIDALDLPLLGRLGRRRGWLVASQLLLAAAVAQLALADPVANPLSLALVALLVAFASATQDIVIDAWRVETLAPEEQAAGMAGYVAAYRVGMLASGAGAILLVAWMESGGIDKALAWRLAMLAMAGLVAIGMIAALLAPEPERVEIEAQEREPVRRVIRTALEAFAEFMLRPAALLALLFVVLFKLTDALAGTMTGPFVLALGYEKAAYAGIVKGVGLAATLIGGFLGGAIAQALSRMQALALALAIQMISNIGFVALAVVPVSSAALAAVIIIENLAGGIGTVIFVAYISALASSRAHTATQFALLTALASVARTLIASLSGYAVILLGWPVFFLATAAAGLPAFAVMAFLARRRHFEGPAPSSIAGPLP
jgi:PAT family beta-lactamase induction signal transducer AmpG